MLGIDFDSGSWALISARLYAGDGQLSLALSYTSNMNGQPPAPSNHPLNGGHAANGMVNGMANGHADPAQAYTNETVKGSGLELNTHTGIADAKL